MVVRPLVVDLADTLVAASGAMRRAERVLLALAAGLCRAVWVTPRRPAPASDPRLVVVVVVRRLGDVLAAVRASPT
jgi:hypothetical protein